MALFVKSGDKFDYSFLRDEGVRYGNRVLFNKIPKTTKIFEFILDILSEPRYSSIISWEGTNGQFAIIRPDDVAYLWGERNGRRNMTYQKFSRALRYYYHKKVLSKIRGRKCVYKFSFRELERQYGYQSKIPFPVTTEPIGNGGYEIPLATCDHFQHPSFAVSSPVMVGMAPHDIQGLSHSPFYPNPNPYYLPYDFNF